MARPVVLQRSRLVPVDFATAMDEMVAIPVAEVFARGWGPFPAVTGVRDQDGDWDQVGQGRTVLLAGGGSTRERVTAHDAPDRLAYTLTDLRGPLGLLATRVEAEWLFVPIGTGTEVSWRWTMQPRSRAAGLLLPVFGRLWQRWADRLLGSLSGLLLRGRS